MFFRRLSDDTDTYLWFRSDASGMTPSPSNFNKKPKKGLCFWANT